MCEYNENRSRSENTAEVVYSPEKNSGCGRKLVTSYFVIKVIIVIFCMATVSVGSIGIYAALNDEENDIDYTVSSDDDNSDISSKAVEAAAVPAAELLKKDAAELTVPEIVKKAKPSVVGISSEFNGGVCTGTGIIISDDGYIVTNAHVVQDTDSGNAVRAEKVTAVLSDNTECTAEIVGADTKTDLAVVKINADGLTLTPAEFGDSNSLTEGEMAVAIGNPLGFELYGSTTCGIISALDRKITVGEYEMTLIQTDAAINPGNSGGPLLNSKGLVIGINSSKIISDYAEGLGFAIPISSAQPIISDLIKNGYVTGRPLIGISGENINDVTSRYYKLPIGVCVRFITPDSAAEKSGIMVGDIIIGINGADVSTMSELNKTLEQFSAGDTVNLSVYRSNSETAIEIPIVLDENKN